jgi:hypothetical protein
MYRMSRTTPLFPTLAKANKDLLHFRFIAHHFISALASYVTDIAITSHFDSFIASLSNPTYDDAFTLGTAHSSLLDDILSACLLRSGQRAATLIVGNAMELVLSFVIVVGRLYENKLQEYEAEVKLADLNREFKAKMRTLVSRVYYYDCASDIHSIGQGP